MADDKKNIGPEVEKTDTAPAPEQPVSDKVEPVAANPIPAEKEAQQTAIPGMGDPAPAPSGKVVDFAAAREEAGKDKAPKEKAAKQKTPTEKDKGTAKASRGRPAKANKAAPDKAKPPKRDKMSQSKARGAAWGGSL